MAHIQPSALSVAAFAVRIFANEMVYASTPASRALQRVRLNESSHSLRTWHEQLLFASSTTSLLDAGSTEYVSHTAVPTYRATPVVEEVRRTTFGLKCLFAYIRHQQLAVKRTFSLGLWKASQKVSLQVLHSISWYS